MTPEQVKIAKQVAPSIVALLTDNHIDRQVIRTFAASIICDIVCETLTDEGTAMFFI